MSKEIGKKLCLGKPRAIDNSTLAMGLFSTTTGRLGQVLISVNVVALYGGIVETPSEITEKIKELLSSEKITSFNLDG